MIRPPTCPGNRNRYTDDLRAATGTDELEILVVLPVGAPLRQLGDIDRAVRTAIDDEAEVLVAGTVWKESEVWRLDAHGDLHAVQDSSTGTPASGEGMFIENSAIIVKLAHPQQVNATPRIRPFPLESWQAPTINDPSDIEACELVFRQALLPGLEEDAPVAPDTLMGEVDLVVYDFDGVMTDNRVLVTQDGTEAVWVNRADGLGVERFRMLGIP